MKHTPDFAFNILCTLTTLFLISLLMTNIAKDVDSEDGSIVDAMDSVSIATAASPEISASEVPSANGKAIDLTDDEIVCSYIGTMIGFRDSICSYQNQSFLKVYSAIITGELAEYSLGDYGSFSAADTEVRVKKNSYSLSKVKQTIDGIFPKLDEAIGTYINVLRGDVKKKAMEEHDDYFREVLDRATSIPFDAVEFGLDPASYLDKFIPWLVFDENLSLTTWRSFLVTCAPPLAGYFIETQIGETADWDTAKAALARAFTLKASKEDIAKYQYAISGNDPWSVIYGRLKSTYNIPERRSCSACSHMDCGYSHSCQKWKERLAKYCSISFINVITSSAQQKSIINSLKMKSVADISTYDFSEL